MKKLPGKKVKHHTVPKFYLANFSDNDLMLKVADLDIKKIYDDRTTKISVKKSFYALSKEMQDELGLDENTFEDWLADEIEAPASKVFRKLLNNEWPLNFEDRKTLADFIAIQFLRGNDHRVLLNEISANVLMEKIRSLGKDGLRDKLIDDFDEKFCEYNLEFIWEMAEAGTLKVENDKGHHLVSIIETVDLVIKKIIGRKWAIVNFHDKNLLTCDTPVIIPPKIDNFEIHGKNYMVLTPMGWDNSPIVYFPISRNIGLCLYDVSEQPNYKFENVIEGIHDMHLPDMDEIYHAFRNGIINNATRQIFCHPADVNTLPNPLPELKKRFYTEEQLKKFIDEEKNI